MSDDPAAPAEFPADDEPNATSDQQRPKTDVLTGPLTRGGKRRPSWYRLHLWQIQGVRDILLLLAVWALLIIGQAFSVVTVPMLLGLGLAYLFEPVVSSLTKRLKLSRGKVVGLITGGLLLGVLLLAVLVVPKLVTQAVGLVVRSGTYVRTLVELSDDDRVPDSIREQLSGLRVLLGQEPPPETTQIITIFDDDEDDDDAPDGDESDPDADDAAGDAATPPGPAAGDGTSGSGTPGPDSATGHDGAVTTAPGGEAMPPPPSETARAPAPAPTQPIIVSQTHQIEDPSPPVAVVTTGEAKPNGPRLQDLVSGAETVWRIASGIVGTLVGLGMAVFLTMFFFVIFANAWPEVIAFFAGLIPPSHQARTNELVVRMDRAVSGFVRGRVIIALINAMILSIGWSLCGVPYALLMGLVIGVLTIIPYLHALGVPLAWLLISLTILNDPSPSGFYVNEGETGWSAIIWWRLLLLPTIPYIVCQLMDDWVMTPLIQGKATDLGIASIIAAVIAGGAVGGIFGMLLAIPVAACVKILTTEVLWPRVQGWIRGERSDPLPLDEA